MDCSHFELLTMKAGNEMVARRARQMFCGEVAIGQEPGARTPGRLAVIAKE
jgi:hypothetical protein